MGTRVESKRVQLASHGLAENNGAVPTPLTPEVAALLGIAPNTRIWGNLDYATKNQTPTLVNPNGSGLMWFNQDASNQTDGLRTPPSYQITADQPTSSNTPQGFKNLNAAVNTTDEQINRVIYDDGTPISQSSSVSYDPRVQQQSVKGASWDSGNPFWQNFNISDAAKQSRTNTTVIPRPVPQAQPQQAPGPQKIYGKPELRSGGWVQPVEWLYPDGGRTLIEMRPVSGPNVQVDVPSQGPQVQAIPGIQSGVGGPFGPMAGTYGAPINAGTPYAGIAVPNVQVLPGTWGAPANAGTAQAGMQSGVGGAQGTMQGTYGAPPASSNIYNGGNVVSTTPQTSVTGQILNPGYSASPYDSRGILKAINPNIGRAPTDTEWQKIYVDLARAKRDYWQNLQQQRAPGADTQLWMAENLLRQWEQMNPSQVATIRFGEQGFAPLLDEMQKWGTGGIDPAVMDYFTARAQGVPNLPQGSLAGGTGTLTQNTSLFGGNWGYMAPDSLVAMGWATPESQGYLPVERLPGDAEESVSGQIVGPWKGGSTFTAPTPGLLQDWNGGPGQGMGNAPTSPWSPNYYGSNNGDGFSITPSGALLYGPGSLPNQSGTENTLSGMSRYLEPGMPYNRDGSPNYYQPETLWRNVAGHNLPWTGPIENPFNPITGTNGQPLDFKAPGAPGAGYSQQPSGWIEQGQVQFPPLLTPHLEVQGGVLQAGSLGGSTGNFPAPPALQANSTGWTTNAGSLIPSAGSAHPSYDPLAADSSGWTPTVQPQSFPSAAEAQWASGQAFPMPLPPMYQSGNSK